MINYADLATTTPTRDSSRDGKAFKCDYCGWDTTECRRSAKINAPCGA